MDNYEATEQTTLETVESIEQLYGTFPVRVRGLVIDGVLVLGVWVLALLALDATASDFTGRVIVLAVAGVILFYDPISVTLAQGTVGHRLVNLRVRDASSGGNLGFFRAFARFALKTVLGLPSFFVMALTRRHQTLHDLLTRSVVVVHDPARATPSSYVLESDYAPAVEVSVVRRVLIIMAYVFVLLASLMLVPSFVVSEACLQLNQCSRGEDRWFSMIGLAMLGALGSVVVLGWHGRLPGARPAKVESSDVNITPNATIEAPPEQRGP